MATLITKADKIHIRYKDVNGIVHTKSTGTADMKKARAILKSSNINEIEEAARLGLLNEEVLSSILASDRVTCSEAFTEWQQWASIECSPRTVTPYADNIRRWMKDMELEGKPIRAVTEQDVSGWVNPEDSPIKINSRALRLSSIQSFFRMCTARKYRLDNPSRRVRIQHEKLTYVQKETTIKEAFSPEEYQLISDHVRQVYEDARMEHETKRPTPGTMLHERLSNKMERYHFWYFAVEMGWHCGLRISDCCLFERESLKPGLVIIHTLKSNTRIGLPLEKLSTANLMRMFRTLEIDETETYLFPSVAKMHMDKRSQIPKLFGDIVKRLNIEGNKSFHSFRHGFVQRWRDAGETYERIASELGHHSPDVTRGYGRKV